MLSAAQFRDIVSGRRKDWRAAALRGALSLVEPLYRAVVQRRNRRYDRGQAKVHQVPVPVISVGNITTGGTGKSPFVAWLARWLERQNVRVAIISRGYGARDGMLNDEALELAALLPSVPLIQNPDRVAAARQAIAEQRSEVLLLDDAFQHRRLHRDLDIVLIDVLEPFGFNFLLPRGLLREPLSGLARARVIGLSRVDLVTGSECAEIVKRIREVAPDTLLVELEHRPQSLVNSEGAVTDVKVLREERVAAFCGIGNPRGFHETLLRCGANIVDFREFSDHFAYESQDVTTLVKWAEQLDVARVVCTMKDLVKLRQTSLGRCALNALTIGIEFRSGQEKLEAMLSSIVSREGGAGRD